MRNAILALSPVFLAGVLAASEPSVPTASGILYDNGPFVNSPGTGEGGADESVVQDGLGLEIAGFDHTAEEMHLEDDFVIPGPNGWWIDSVTVFGYEDGSTLESPFTAASVRIWTGVPYNLDSRVVYGAIAVDGLRYTTWTGAYRISDLEPGISRPIMANTIRVGVMLTPGTYWLEWWASGPTIALAPPITITGQADTGNAHFYIPLGGVGAPLEDNGHPQGLPFVLRGRQVSCRAPAAPIPDGDPAGLSDEVVLGAGEGVIDVNLHVAVTHPIVANLVVSLEHDPGGTAVAAVDRRTCTESDIVADFDDEATVSVLDVCEGSGPALPGHLIPENPLSAFDAESAVGTWTLTVADEVENFTGTLDAWCLDLIAPTFDDVPADAFGAVYVEALQAAEVTGGCGSAPLIYCPDDFVTRAQMAVFLLKGRGGPYFRPGAPSGDVFDDVGEADFAAAWIERLSAEGITGGCSSAPPLYCPQANVTRAQMAVFLLRAKHGPLYSPAPATGLVFQDVQPGDFAADWIEALYAEGITGGCQAVPALYCPGASVTRAQMAVFLVRAFDLPLP